MSIEARCTSIWQPNVRPFKLPGSLCGSVRSHQTVPALPMVRNERHWRGGQRSSGSTNRFAVLIIRTRWTLFAALALSMSVPALAASIAYDFTMMAKTGDMISGKTLTGFRLPSFGANSPAINASDQMAFYATYSEGDFAGEGIFTPTSLVLKTGDVVNGQTLDGISFLH
jgi:hypothetical protein